jgi:hypothetical protein
MLQILLKTGPVSRTGGLTDAEYRIGHAGRPHKR